MSCHVYVIDTEMNRRYIVGNIRIHTEMAKWLKEYGDKEQIYELLKGNNIHSRWCWKIKKDKWGKMSTPSKK